MFLKASLIFLTTVVSIPTLSEPADPIYVFGHRANKSRQEKAGRSYRILPNAHSSISEEFKDESNLNLDRENLSLMDQRYSLRFRGHSSLGSEVYFERMSLFDPQSSLSKAPLLDLNALGFAEIFIGSSPARVPMICTSGCLFFGAPKNNKRQVSISSSSHKEHSASLLFRQQTPKWGSQIYARTSQWDGRFSFHDTNGTPANSKDDKEDWREHNDQREQILLPMLAVSLGSGVFRYLLLQQDTNRAIPIDPSKGRAKFFHRFHYVSWQATKNEFIPSVYAFSRRQNRESRFSMQESKMKLNSKGIGIHGDFSIGDLDNYWQLEHSELGLGFNNTTADFEQEQVKGYFGSTVALPSKITANLKYQISQLKSDQGKDQSSSQSLNLISKHLKHVFPWFQISRSQRMPSLLERFGDGSGIEANDTLSLESHLHAEFGAHFNFSNIRLKASGFRDRSENKITFLPTRPGRFQARNIGNVHINGWDMFGDIKFQNNGISVSYTNLQTEIGTFKLPHTSIHNANMEFRNAKGPFQYKWQHHYRSEWYRDSGNRLRYPSLYTSDFHFSYTETYDHFLMTSQFSVLNIYNLRKKRAYGQTFAYSETYGYPLPGRFLRYSLALRF